MPRCRLSPSVLGFVTPLSWASLPLETMPAAGRKDRVQANILIGSSFEGKLVQLQILFPRVSNTTLAVFTEQFKFPSKGSILFMQFFS